VTAVPGPRPGPAPRRPDIAEEPPAHPEVTRAVEELARDLPALPLSEHHDRFAAVLELLHTVLETDAA